MSHIFGARFQLQDATGSTIEEQSFEPGQPNDTREAVQSWSSNISNFFKKKKGAKAPTDSIISTKDGMLDLTMTMGAKAGISGDSLCTKCTFERISRPRLRSKDHQTTPMTKKEYLRSSHGLSSTFFRIGTGVNSVASYCGRCAKKRTTRY